MKFRKTILILVVLIFTFLIYKVSLDKKLYYLSIGDFISLGIEQDGVLKGGYNELVVEYIQSVNKLEFFSNAFSDEDMRIVDLKKMIDNNETIYIDGKILTIKNALVKSDLLILSVGMNDLMYKINNIDDNVVYKYLNEIILDMDETLGIIRKYCKEDIILLGYYDIDETNDDFIKYINSKISNLVSYYNIHFINIDDIVDKTNLENSSFLNSKDYELISNVINEYIENEIFR